MKKALVLIFLSVAALLSIRWSGQPHSKEAVRPTMSEQAPDKLPKVFLLNPDTLVQNKQKIQTGNSKYISAYASLLRDADNLLQQSMLSITDKSQTAMSGDKHDYLSLAPYAWPNPKTPNNLPYLFIDGKINPERNDIPDYRNMTHIISWSHTLALAYFFSNDSVYANKAAAFLRTWFVDSDTRMNPNLNFAQVVTGNTKGTAPGIIDGLDIPQVIDTMGLLQPSKVLSAQDTEALHAWFAAYLNWLLTSQFGQTEASASNNIGTWYDVQIISIALYLDKYDTAKQRLMYIKNVRIPEQILASGEQPHELTRSRSWNYSVFNVQALCTAAALGSIAHIDLWHYETPVGQSITKAINLLIPYALNQKRWPHPQITDMSLQSLIVPLKLTAVGTHNNWYQTAAENIQQHVPYNYIYTLAY